MILIGRFFRWCTWFTICRLNQILKILKKTYCSNIGYEFMHMGDPNEKSWIRDRIEGPKKDITFTKMEKKQFK